MAQNNGPSANGNGDGSTATRRRGPGRPFPRGVSGNPGGRPRAALDVQALAREHTLEAVTTLVKALSNERLCVTAAVALLDRGWGKPKEHVELGGTERVTSVVLRIVSAGGQPPGDGDMPGVITISTGDD
jgi:hypothetical protein